MGIHTGEVEVHDGGIVGRTVDVCRTLAELAGAGEVLVSGTVTDLIADPSIAFGAANLETHDRVPRSLRVSRVGAPQD